MGRRGKSWINTRFFGTPVGFLKAAIGTSPADVKELPGLTEFPFDPSPDTEMANLPSSNPEQDLGLTRTASGVKVVSKIVIRHPDNPNLVLFGLRRDDQAWCVPGGHVDSGETPMEAMFREFFEECGMELSSAEHVLTVQVADKPVVVHLFEGQGPSPEIWESLSSDEDPDSEFLCYQYINPLDTDFPLHVPAGQNAIVYYLSEPEQRIAQNSLLDLTTEKEAHKKIAILRQKKNEETGKVEWALLGRKAPHRVLKWFGAEKPSDERVNKEEQRIQYFKHHGSQRTAETSPPGAQTQAPPTYWPMGPEPQFKRTEDSRGDSYHDENMWEDADLHLQGAEQTMAAAIAPYDQGGMSPADDMRESLGEIFYQQHASLDKDANWGHELCMDKAISLENSKGLTLETMNKREDFNTGDQTDRSIRTPI